MAKKRIMNCFRNYRQINEDDYKKAIDLINYSASLVKNSENNRNVLCDYPDSLDNSFLDDINVFESIGALIQLYESSGIKLEESKNIVQKLLELFEKLIVISKENIIYDKEQDILKYKLDNDSYTKITNLIDLIEKSSNHLIAKKKSIYFQPFKLNGQCAEKGTLKKILDIILLSIGLEKARRIYFN